MIVIEFILFLILCIVWGILKIACLPSLAIRWFKRQWFCQMIEKEKGTPEPLYGTPEFVAKYGEEPSEYEWNKIKSPTNGA